MTYLLDEMKSDAAINDKFRIRLANLVTHFVCKLTWVSLLISNFKAVINFENHTLELTRP